MSLASAIPVTSQSRWVKFRQRIRSCFSCRLLAKESLAKEPQSIPVIEQKPILTLTPSQHAANLEKLAEEKIRAGDLVGAGPLLVASAFFYNEIDNPIRACRLLSRAARLYLKAGDSELARMHYKAASDLADAWRFYPLSRHYQKCAGEIPAAGAVPPA